jgi:hypothetical protein
MRYIIVTGVLFLTGCVTPAPVKHAFPTPPPVIVERCPDLHKLAENEEKLSELLKTVSKNYALYHDCAAKHDLIVKWLKEQTEIHDSVFNKGK